MRVDRVIAIDGPSGSGKSTVGRAVARALGLPVLDTGAMYRSVTLAVLERGIDPTDADGAAALARACRLEQDGRGRVLLDGRDVGEAIRGPEVTAAVSTVSAHPEVRAELVARQRAWVEEHGGGVVEGRDIGTVVFPEVPVKVFLTASDDVRARRRHGDEAAAARPTSVAAVRDDLARRDAHDAGRAVSPLRAAPDAVVIDASARSADDIAGEIVGRARAAAAAQ